MQTELLLLVILKALAELAFMFLLGRGVLYVLAGRKREGNIFYQVLRVVTDPVIHAARWVDAAARAGRPYPVGRRRAGGLDLAGDRVLGAAGDVRVGLRLHGAVREQAMREPLLHLWAQTLLFFGLGDPARARLPRGSARASRARKRRGARWPICMRKAASSAGDSGLRTGAGAAAGRRQPVVQRGFAMQRAGRPCARDGAHATRDRRSIRSSTAPGTASALARACRPL